ncbi:MAPEG family protein [Altererythrobacter salegens]|uniref:MAPEG family protein n=1 Tax=Croceibacterium salegens TaxID=1737568 RepID=A0A6I4SY93_9SPHN|nr:MAPEG family protein [Croceibacterium salegens]MXO60100.1 MAPEG family protein [Croceibacterium salegens]
MILLPTTLSAAAAAALLNFWLSTRVAKVRRANQIAHGDGGNALLGRRMRAHMNFVEYTPFVLILCAAIELAGRGGMILKAVMAIYMLARVAHAIGMDDDNVPKTRVIGIAITFLTMLGLAIYAVLIAAGVV